MKISVLTPTIRKEGLEIVSKGLARQVFKDFEWIIGSSFRPVGYDAEWVEDDFTGGHWSLNRIYNKMIRHAKGDLIVSIQDHTFFQPDALDRFWFHFEKRPETVISGVGDKYEQVYPIQMGKSWEDPRRTGFKGLRPVLYNEVEGNFCSAPKSVLFKVGGFDEELDYKGFGMDWYSVLERLSHYDEQEFFIDESIESYSETHGRPVGWEEHNAIHGPYQKRRRDYVKRTPLKYL